MTTFFHLRRCGMVFLYDVCFGPIGPREYAVEESENIWANAGEDVAFRVVLQLHSLNVIVTEAITNALKEISERDAGKSELWVEFNEEQLFIATACQASSGVHLAFIEYLEVIVLRVEFEEA